VIEIYSQFGQLVMSQNVSAGSNGVFVNTVSLAEEFIFTGSWMQLRRRKREDL